MGVEDEFAEQLDANGGGWERVFGAVRICISKLQRLFAHTRLTLFVHNRRYYVRDELAFADPEHVRRATGAKDGQSYSASTGRSVLKSEHLANRRNRLKKRVANLLLGELAEEDVEMMELVGEGTYWAWEPKSRPPCFTSNAGDCSDRLR